MPSAYLIADVDVHDPVQYENYRTLSTLAMKAHGAQPCIRGGQVVPLEGGWNPKRIVTLKFASLDAARAFYDSPEYLAARKAREGIATMRMILVEGAD